MTSPVDPRHDPLHQPPNGDDLRRVPPAGPVCAHVRGLLRDYVDGDLVAEQAREVEEHVHECRVCAVELARAEHEVLRLRRAFMPQGITEPELPPSFAQRVVDRLVMSDAALDDPSPGSPSVGEDADGPAGSRLRVGRGPWGRGDLGRGARGRERDGSIGSPAGMLVAGLFFLFVLGVGVRFFASEDPAPANTARLVMVMADGTFDGDRQLSRGDSAEGVRVARGGLAYMDYHAASAGTQPAATIEMYSGKMRLQDGAPMLVDGKVLISTNRAVDIPLGDGSHIGLGIGEYVIAAEIPADMLSDERPEDDPLALMPGDLQIEVEVRSGEPARILRAGSPPTVIAAGNVGVYQGGGAVDVGSSPVAGSGPFDQRTIAAGDPDRLPVLSGVVVGPAGLPSVGADVVLAFASMDVARQGLQTTGADGSFVLLADDPCDSDFAVVLASPHVLRQDLGLVVRHAVRVHRQGAVTHLAEAIGFSQSAPLFGVVRDDLSQLRVGVQVVPLLVDELFGTVMALVGHRAYTDAMGSFRIDRLPARLPAHQSLVLLLSQDGLEPTLVPVPARGSLVAAMTGFTTMVARRVRTILVRGLPGSSLVTVFEEVPGLPPGSTAVRRTAVTNIYGFVTGMPVGRGRLWVRTGPPNNAVLRELVRDEYVGVLPRYKPVGEPVAYETKFRPLQPLADSQVAVVNSYRHQRFVLSAVANAVTSQALRAVDGLSLPVVAAEVFAVKRSGPRGTVDVRFLGFTSPQGVLSLGALGPNEDVFVIGGDGATGWLHEPANMALTVVLPLSPTGRAYLHPSLRPGLAAVDRVVTLQFRRALDNVLPGIAPVAVRFASDANDWEVGDLPPGNYEVDVGGETYAVAVPAMGWVWIQ